MVDMSTKKHHIDFVFVLCLFVMFAVVLLYILFFGVRVYQSISQKANLNYEQRTSLLYLVNKIRAYEQIDCIELGTFEDQDALLLKEEINGIEYVTKVYEYDGQLMELFMEEGTDLEPVAGTKITQVHSLDMEKLENGLVQFTVELMDGSNSSIVIKSIDG